MPVISPPNNTEPRGPTHLNMIEMAAPSTIININRVIVRDANLSSFINEFSEEFAGYIIASLIDFFSNYNQIKLDEKSRDLITFHTSIGLLKVIIFS